MKDLPLWISIFIGSWLLTWWILADVKRIPESRRVYFFIVDACHQFDDKWIKTRLVKRYKVCPTKADLLIVAAKLGNEEDFERIYNPVSQGSNK